MLASASPRRVELLSQLGLRPKVQPANIDESPREDETGAILVKRLAREKAMAIESNLPVLAADTVVVKGSRVYGKPENRSHGVEMLLSLSGGDHSVITAVSLKTPERHTTIAVQTTVTFTHINEARAEQYWATGEPVGKAGSYAIQGLGAVFVTHIEGSYSNVMGLPLFETAQLLKDVGLDCLSGVRQQ